MSNSLGHSLLLDAEGKQTDRHLVLRSNDWDEVRESTTSVYMPFRVTPQGKLRRPDSFHYTAQIGGFTLSRFRYGIPVFLDQFDPQMGRCIALTTVSGGVRHSNLANTRDGESYLVDVSRAPYTLEADAGHVQLNLSFPHQLIASLYERLHGVKAKEAMWKYQFKFGGPGSSWYSLLEYATRCIAESPQLVEHGPVGKHLEEMLGMSLLSQWHQRFGEPEADRLPQIAPRYVRHAEDYLREHAREAPTLTEVAEVVGVSVRGLSGAFRSFRNTTPMAYLREVRLQGIRADLLAAETHQTVSTIVAGWGFVNMGVFARAYVRRFGELPSQTLQRLRR